MKKLQKLLRKVSSISKLNIYWTALLTLLLKTHNINFALSDPKNKKLQVPSEQVMDETCKDFVQLWEVIDAVRVIGEASESLEARSDIKTATEDMKLYVNQIIWDIQQKKAKAFAFDSLDEASCFWLKHYCQKILPMTFREGPIDYFGKKGMTLYVDIIFTMVNMKLQKNILHKYANCRSRCKRCPSTSRHDSEKTSSWFSSH